MKKAILFILKLIVMASIYSGYWIFVWAMGKVIDPITFSEYWYISSPSFLGVCTVFAFSAHKTVDLLIEYLNSILS